MGKGLVQHQTQARAVWGGEGRGGGVRLYAVSSQEKRSSILTTAIIQQEAHQNRWLGRGNIEETVSTGRKVPGTNNNQLTAMPISRANSSKSPVLRSRAGLSRLWLLSETLETSGFTVPSTESRSLETATSAEWPCRENRDLLKQ